MNQPMKISAEEQALIDLLSAEIQDLNLLMINLANVQQKIEQSLACYVASSAETHSAQSLERLHRTIATNHQAFENLFQFIQLKRKKECLT